MQHGGHPGGTDYLNPDKSDGPIDGDGGHGWLGEACGNSTRPAGGSRWEATAEKSSRRAAAVVVAVDVGRRRLRFAWRKRSAAGCGFTSCGFQVGPAI
jgi:hypothetical protein